MKFNCHFSRSVSLDHETEVDSMPESPRSLQRKNNQSKLGTLKYDFKVEHEEGKIKIKIEPMHKIKDIIAK